MMLGLDVIFDPIANALNNHSARLVMTIVRAILFVGSWLVPKKKTSGSLKPKSFSIGAMIALGFTTSLLEVATALPYFAAIGILNEQSFSLLRIVAHYSRI
ncbi:MULTISPECIES: hypothetical protein [unclassified Lysinibacillus]|uniref:hypothetical protein n=1 Tax=unclassified Lysinibacillus TaxID=2636778 RepID=UPI003818F6C0